MYKAIVFFVVILTAEVVFAQTGTANLSKYYHPQEGLTITDLIKRALVSNQELSAARFEIDKSRARLIQARLRPNPTFDLEHQSERLVGGGGDRQFTVGASLPLETSGRRDARVSVAQIEIEASEALFKNRERILAASILTNYAEALGALRELDTLERILDLDLQTARFVQVRVSEGETPPLELNILQAEIERMRSRRELAEGRLQSAVTQLKVLVGMPMEEPLRLREQINSTTLPSFPASADAALAIALRTRPDIRLAQIEEQAASAGLRLVNAQSKPDLTAYTRYSQGRSSYHPPTLPFSERDRSLTFGVAITVPLFNKNQGARAEAEIAIRQAQSRREFAERVVRGEIQATYQRLEAARQAVSILETTAIPRSEQNVETFRRVYEVGEIKITELIAEQRRLLDANRDLTDALTQRYKAQADLHIAIGAAELLPASK